MIFATFILKLCLFANFVDVNIEEKRIDNISLDFRMKE